MRGTNPGMLITRQAVVNFAEPNDIASIEYSSYHRTSYIFRVPVKVKLPRHNNCHFIRLDKQYASCLYSLERNFSKEHLNSVGIESV